MTQIDAAGLTFTFNAFDPDDVDFATNVANTPFSQTWDSTDSNRITALSYLGDITPALAGTVHGISILDTSFSNGLSITGLNTPLTDILDTADAANNQRKFWDTVLDGDTTILTALSATLSIMGDFVRVAAGETKVGGNDTFTGANASGGGGVLTGDAITVNAGGTLTGGVDTFTDTFGYTIIGDVGEGSSGNNILGTVLGGDDVVSLTDPNYTPQRFAASIVGDVDYTDFGSALTGGDDSITLRNLSSASSIYGDVLDAEGMVTGGDDTILLETTIPGRSFMFGSSVHGDGGTATDTGGTFTAMGGDDAITLNNVSASFIYGDFGSSSNVTFMGGDDVITAAGTFELTTPAPSPDVTPSVSFIYGDTSSSNAADDQHYTGGDDQITLMDALSFGVHGDTSSFTSSGNSTFTGGKDTISVHFSRGDRSFSSTIYGDAVSVAADSAVGGDDVISVDLIGSQSTSLTIYADVTSYSSGGSDDGDFTGGDDTVWFNGDSNQMVTIYGDLASASATTNLTLRFGDDHLTGGQANDTLYGDSAGAPTAGGTLSVIGGDDVLDGRGGNDQLFGGDGSDTAAFDSLNQSVMVFLDGIPGSNPSDPIHAIGQGNDKFDSIENVTGSSQDDVIVGDSNANILMGGDGNDILNGNGGSDVLNGGGGTGDRVVFNGTQDQFLFATSDLPDVDLIITDGRAAPGAKDNQVTDVEFFQFTDGTLTQAEVTTLAQQRRLESDFTGDDTDDILWRNTTTDQTLIWDFNEGGTRGASLFPGTAPAGSEIHGLGDFSRDGSDDIVWRDTATGAVVIWDLEQGTRGADLNPGTVSTAWQIQGTGDFTGDGSDDLVWRNTTSGQTLIWDFEDGVRAASLFPGTVSTDWQIRGTGDFTGDGVEDVLWRNQTSGQTLIWEFDEGGTRGSSLFPGTVSTAWQIQGTGDFTGDGIDDVLWRNATSGQTLIWDIEAGGTRGASLFPGTLSSAWEIQGVGDYSGDDSDDIVWRHSTTGEAVIWDFEAGGTRGASLFPGTVSTAWDLEATPFHYDFVI